ncbi:MAG: DUF4258 domain-containing protein [Solirubrobacterales bacterium]
MELSRHAKNKLRGLPMTQQDVEAMISRPQVISRDEQGRPLYLGMVRGTPICAVVAVDEPDLIVTIFRRERW